MTVHGTSASSTIIWDGTKSNSRDPNGDGVLEGSGGGGELTNDQFIRTFAIKYGGDGDATRFEDAPTTAKLDLLIAEPWSYDATAWVEGANNAWNSIRAYNSDIIIATYTLSVGATEAVDTNKQIGDGITWIKNNHGAGQTGDNRWLEVAEGDSSSYLQGQVFDNQRAMYAGSSTWRDYWRTQIYSDRWGGAKGMDHDGVDGLFLDITGFQVTDAGSWEREGTTTADHPSRYYNGGYLHTAFEADMTDFFNEAVPYFEGQAENIKIFPNFGPIDDVADMGKWDRLDAITSPPQLAMVEAGFVQKYGANTFGIFSYSNKIEQIAQMENTAVVLANHGDKDDLTATDLTVMDEAGSLNLGGTITGWEALWFVICSAAMVRNANNDNVYVGFTLWGYTKYYVFDEYDPQFIHLGSPVAAYSVDGDGCYVREYDDGWVVTNPTLSDFTGKATPGSASVKRVDHDNFKDLSGTATSTTYDIARGRGVILLKDGATLGDGS